MASLASKFMINDNSRNSDKKKAESVTYNALIHSTETDLTVLLLATKTGIDRLPVLCLTEAKA